ncbi:hypothetical protein JOD43_003598 [Pullulanibacillus pueri]|uniref:YhzD-like protein n=1 Tax=Pullulanibacillus pueri TaxID=1437324 RepID=A0A8J2ZZ82_9BACL|nr:YhzD family protein [Pullulanibacillus pueri]MBM7683418.1 hypothetical protein [Pullulanibacillus pueri]GGH88069.1 hypothetical protein GCM10007096_39540 [Pullulanibacillus pueri]
MRKYILTVFKKDGTKLLDESFEAADDKEARRIGEQRLDEQQYSDYTSRVTSPTGKLVHFHR